MNNLTLADAIAILNEDSPNEEVDEFVICCAETKMQLDQAIDAEDTGEMSEDETDETIATILMEHGNKAMDIFDLEVDLEIEEPAEYSQNNNYVASFSEGLGSVLAGLIDEEYENPSDGIDDLAEATGSTRATIEGIIAGDLVPDLTMGEQIAEVFDSLQDESAYKEWNSLVANAFGEVLEEYEPMTEENPQTQQAIATMSAQQNELIAEFNQIKNQAQLGEELRVLDKQAEGLVEQGIITPFEKQELLGNFAEKEDAIALFTEACQAMNTPVQVQLDRIKYFLHTKQRTGQPNAMFSEVSDGQYIDPSELSEGEQNFVAEYLNEII